MSTIANFPIIIYDHWLNTSNADISAYFCHSIVMSVLLDIKSLTWFTWTGRWANSRSYVQNQALQRTDAGTVLSQEVPSRWRWLVQSIYVASAVGKTWTRFYEHNSAGKDHTGWIHSTAGTNFHYQECIWSCYGSLTNHNRLSER